jgi:hypothetical protein
MMMRRNLAWAVVSATLAAAVWACGGSSNPNEPTGTCTPSPNPNTIVIQGNQVCPRTLTVARGSQLIMINNDTRVHEMDSDPHPEHTQCPELNQIDFLNPGQQRSSGNLNTVRTCGFHDHTNPDNGNLKGTVTIQ